MWIARWPWSFPAAGLAGLALASLGACGALPAAQPYTAAAALLPLSEVNVSSAPAYIIDDGIDINVPYGSFGLAQSGSAFSLTWQHDQAPATYSGDLYGPKAGQLLVVISSMVPAAQVQLVAHDHVHFSIRSEPNVRYRLQFEATKQPLGLWLQIDGQDAVNPRIAFASGRQLASVETMPIRLVGARVTPAMLEVR